MTHSIVPYSKPSHPEASSSSDSNDYGYEPDEPVVLACIDPRDVIYSRDPVSSRVKESFVALETEFATHRMGVINIGMLSRRSEVLCSPDGNTVQYIFAQDEPINIGDLPDIQYDFNNRSGKYFMTFQTDNAGRVIITLQKNE
jgi:hypothetical protein